MNAEGGHNDDDTILVRLSGPQVGCGHCGWWHEGKDEADVFAAFAAHRCPVESEASTGETEAQ